MLREQREVINMGQRILDLGLTCFAFVCAFFIRKELFSEVYGNFTSEPNYTLVLLMILVIWYITFKMFGLYRPYRKRLFSEIFWNLITAICVGMLIVVLLMYMLRITDVSRVMMGFFVLLDIVILAIWKGIVYKTLIHYRKKGHNFRNVLIVGCRDRAKDVIININDRIGSGYRILGCVDLHKSEIGKTVKHGIKIIGTVDDYKDILLNHVVDEIIFAMPLCSIGGVHDYISFAEEVGVPVRIVPDWQIHRLMYQPGIARIQLEDFLGIPTMALTTTPHRQVELLIKSTFDYIFAGVAFMLCLPLILLISCSIKVFSKGPVFFKQERCGLNGRRFTLYKFRTMVMDAERRRKKLEAKNEVDGPVFKIKRDPRIIPYLGTFLRKTGLDELPQLINVLKGEMSLVGPRPPIPAEVEQYQTWQRRRLSMKPGLTGLWQSTPNRNDVTFEEWMSMDLNYIDNWSLGLDLKIFLRTTKIVVMGAGR
jgi:exopolysaccharide biosynthesis polyprenyl glycosylphosphotransferase